MKSCALCKKEIEVDSFFSRKAVCPACGADLHICLNCRFYSEKAHNKCLEPKAEFQRTRDRANFCDYYSFSEGGPQPSSAGTDAARKAFEDLFRK